MNRYLIPEALEQGCDTLISIGGVQSNHTRQVAGVAAKLGLKVPIASPFSSANPQLTKIQAKLVQEHWVDWNDPGYSKVGNIQLSRLMGAAPRLDPSSFGIGHKATLAALTEEVIAEGGKP